MVQAYGLSDEIGICSALGGIAQPDFVAWANWRLKPVWGNWGRRCWGGIFYINIFCNVYFFYLI